jgi:DHA1 family multidrug resistance protein-like MFS transporter
MNSNKTEPPPSSDTARSNQTGTSSWRRTLIVVWITEFIALIGFAVVMPFLPLYVKELGVTDPNQVKFWSGLILAAHSVTMAIFAPIWGSLADRYGRKRMLERATFGGAIVMTLMGFAQSPQQLLVLRLIQGALTGTVPAATTLVASIVPRERTGFALGWLQMGIFGGVSIGPLVGGVIADTLGYQSSFFFTGVCLLLAGLGVLFFAEENFKRPAPKPKEEGVHWWDDFAQIIRSRELVMVLVTRVLTRTGGRIIGPVLPLFVETLLPPGSRVATMTGLVSGASAAASSVGAVIWGRTGDRVGYRRVLLVSAVTGSVFYFLQSMVTNTTQLLILQLGVGAALAGTVSSLTSLLATMAPEGQQGAVYGLDTSVVSGANALGPMLGATLAVAWGNRATFVLGGGVLALAAIVVTWLLPQPQSGMAISAGPAQIKKRQVKTN